MLTKPISCAVLLALLVGGCATRGGDVAYNAPDFGAPDAAPPAATAEDYVLSPGDVVTITVFELDSVSGDREIDDTGLVALPLIGPIKGAGVTTAQLSAAIAERLKREYLQSPHVAVAIKTPAERLVTVEGAVDHPGVFPIAQSTTLIQTIAQARGLTGEANPKRVVVFRTIDGARQAASFDLVTIRRGKDPDPTIYPQDLIVVDGSNLASRYRELLRAVPLASFFTRF